jgi:hypothetical protein
VVRCFLETVAACRKESVSCCLGLDRLVFESGRSTPLGSLNVPSLVLPVRKEAYHLSLKLSGVNGSCPHQFSCSMFS